MAAWLHQLTCPRQRAFAPGHQARYPASYARTFREESPALRPLFSCCLSAAGVRFLSTLSCQGVQPPLRSAYRTACAYPRLRCGPMARFPRSARVRPGPGRALSVPRGQRCSPAALHPRPPPAASQRPVPATPATQPSPECELDEASARVSWQSPYAGPSPHLWPPWLEQRPSGFSVSSAPGRSGTGHARHGGDGSDTDP